MPEERVKIISLISRGNSLGSFAKIFALRILKILGFKTLTGPEALENNLILGLKKNRTGFNLNPKISELSDSVCVLNSFSSAVSICKLKDKARKIIVGPNLSARHMADLAKSFPLIHKFLAPSPQVKFTYERYGVPAQKICIWPVGIDTEKFYDASGVEKKYDVLIYFKRRKISELSEVKKLLKTLGLSYKILAYGSYKPDDLLNVGSRCRCGVILDGTESQGIAIEELMALNLPLFVFDQIYLGDSENEWIKENLAVTSVPYWDGRCGVRVPTDTFSQSKNLYFKIPDCLKKLEYFLQNLNHFRPRQFVVENLSLEKQAKEFITLFD